MMLKRILENKIQYKGGGGGGYYHTYYYYPKEVLTEAHKMFNAEIKKVFDNYDKEIEELLINFRKKMQEIYNSNHLKAKETNKLIMKIKKNLLDLEDKKEYTQKEKEKKIWLESILNELEEIMEI